MDTPMAHQDPRDEGTGTPRWVKVFGIIAAVVIVLFVVLLIAGGGGHGPGRHTADSDTPPFDVGEHTAPVDHR
jgi:hypothetical protein